MLLGHLKSLSLGLRCLSPLKLAQTLLRRLIACQRESLWQPLLWLLVSLYHLNISRRLSLIILYWLSVFRFRIDIFVRFSILVFNLLAFFNDLLIPILILAHKHLLIVVL